MRRSSVAALALLVACVGSAGGQNAETRQNLLHKLSGPFIVYRSAVQQELKLSDDQKQRLQAELPDYIQATAKVVEKHKGSNGEQERAMHSHREKSAENFWALLKKTLTAEQLERLQQLEVQHEGPPALFRPEVASELKITHDQQQQLMRVIEELQKKLESLMKEAESKGNPDEIMPRAIKLREDYDRKVEAVLSVQQNRQWQAMRGQPFDVWHE